MKINIKGPVISDGEQWIYDWFGIPAVSPGKVSQKIDEAIKNHSKELTVAINSGGGSVFSASDIYTSLKSFKGKVNVEIVGIAASAASVIAMSGTNITMSPTAQLMIHNASTSSWGDYREMDHTSDFLQKVNQSIMNAYIAKTRKTPDELKGMMDAETWLTAQEAKEAGFIDTIMFEQEVGAVANLERPELVNGMLPKEVIDKIRKELANDRSGIVVNESQQQGPKNKGVKQPMDLEKLKNDYPELYKQIKNEGHQEGVQAENARFKAIDDIASPGFDDLVNKAKYETPIAAEQLAVEMIKAQKQAGSNFLNARKEDAAPLNSVEGAAAPQNTQEQIDNEAAAIGNEINKRRGIK